MPYKNHPTRPLTPESKSDKWAEKMTAREFTLWAVGLGLLFGVAQIVWWWTA